MSVSGTGVSLTVENCVTILEWSYQANNGVIMKNKKQTQVTIGVGVIVIALIWLVLENTRSSSIRYFEVKEIAAEAASLDGRQIRMRGKVKNGSINKDRESLKVRFVIQDELGKTSYPVEYSGIVPDTFKDGSEVVVDGTFHRDATFEATMLQAKCPSKYEMQDRGTKGQMPKNHTSAPADNQKGY